METPASGDGPQAPEKSSSPYRDLLPRLVSGLVLAGVAAAMTWWGLKPFGVLVLAVTVALSWEWGGMIRTRMPDLTFAVHAICVAAAVGLAAYHQVGYALLVLIVGTLAIAVLPLGGEDKTKTGSSAGSHPNSRPMSAAGVLYAGLPALSVMWLRGDAPHGLSAVIFLFVVVWTTDVCAYIAGRSIGGAKLWPAVSPGKTWAGFTGGVACGVNAGIICALFLPAANTLVLAVTALVLAVISQLGDLAESALKRRFGIKDSGSLIPGHGGFMDRVDGFVAAALLAALFALLVNMSAPAQALLYWM